jgi:hypothetical protein
MESAGEIPPPSGKSRKGVKSEEFSLRDGDNWLFAIVGVLVNSKTLS